MAVSKKEVEHVARLARLGLSETEQELFTKQLSAIIDYAGALKTVDTKDIPAASHAIPMKNVLREDKAIACPEAREIMALAPEAEKGMFRVPKILE